jgi:hypothetical protein
MPRRFLFLASAFALAIPAAASAAPTAVDVRIEGQTSTIFNQPVTTDGKTITTTAGGTHLCDGSTAAPPVGPGPTPNSALDDAAIKGGFTWDGPWFGTDFFASRIADETESLADGHFWGVFVNGSMLPVGGCQWILNPGDEVLWAYDAFSKTGGALTLTGEEATQTDRPLRVRVTKTGTTTPVAGATVGSATTGADGVALVPFDKIGIYRIKADKDLFVRSDEIRVCVDPPMVEACTSTDRKAPSIRLDAPAIASTDARYGFVRLSWQGDDGTDGSGVRRYRVDRRVAGSKSGVWHRVALDTPRTLARVPAKEGATYEYRVQAIDRAGNFSPYALATSAMPVDNLSSDLRFSKRGWRTLRRQGAFKLAVSRATRAGASVSMRFSGTGATLVTRTLPRGGKVRITLDGQSKVVSLKGRGRFRRKLVRTDAVPAGNHELRIVSLGRAPVEIDAVAIRP